MADPEVLDKEPSSRDSVAWLAWWLDEAFRIPGTRFRIGLDAIVGLIPGIGETITLILQCAVVFTAVLNYPVPYPVVARMVINIWIDSLFGAIPLLGDVFDLFFKANTRNIRLLKEVETYGKLGAKVPVGRHIGFIAMVGFVLLATIAMVLTLIFFAIRALLAIVNLL